MEKKSKLKLFLVSLVMMGCSYGFTSCSDDDDEVKEPTLEEVNGNYKGKMAMNMASTYASLTMSESAAESVDIEATAKSDTVYFSDFPVEGIIGSIVSEEQAEILKAILKLIKVEYAIGYTASFNAAKDSIVLDLDPKPLEMSIPLSEDEVQSIKVTVSAADDGSYSIGGKKLKFGIKVTRVEVNGTALPNVPEINFDFDMEKK